MDLLPKDLPGAEYTTKKGKKVSPDDPKPIFVCIMLARLPQMVCGNLNFDVQVAHVKIKIQKNNNINKKKP